MNKAITIEDVRDAARQLEGIAVHTKLIENDILNERTGGRIFIKPECLQRTGSFKIRGAYNCISRLSEDDKKRGVVAFSSGNHAQGVACASRMLGVPATIVMPTDAPAIKVANTKGFGAEVDKYMSDGSDEMRLEKYSLSWVDKIFLFRRNIKCAYKIGDNKVFIVCKNRNVEYVMMKFSYAGNIQYHRIENHEIKKLVHLFNSVKLE